MDEIQTVNPAPPPPVSENDEEMGETMGRWDILIADRVSKVLKAERERILKEAELLAIRPHGEEFHVKLSHLCSILDLNPEGKKAGG